MNRLMHMGIIHGAPDSSDAYLEAERKFRKLAHRETESEKRRRESVEAQKLQPLDGLTAEAIEGFRKVLDDRGKKPAKVGSVVPGLVGIDINRIPNVQSLWQECLAPDAQADTYEHLKAAQEAGKQLQCWHSDPEGWWDYVVGSGGFSSRVDRYRIKPEPPACPTADQYRHMQGLERMSNYGPMPTRLCDKCGMKHLPVEDAQYHDPAVHATDEKYYGRIVVDMPVLKVPRDALEKAEAAGFRLQYCSQPFATWKNRTLVGERLALGVAYRVEPLEYSIAGLQRLHECGLPVQYLSQNGIGWIRACDIKKDGYEYRLAPHKSEAV